MGVLPFVVGSNDHTSCSELFPVSPKPGVRPAILQFCVVPASRILSSHPRWVPARERETGRNCNIASLTPGFGVVAAGRGTGEAISVNGRHFGVQVGDMIYDLHNPKGVPLASWSGAYQSRGAIVLVPE